MEKISDYGTYTDGMRKSMPDKTWFLDKIDGVAGIVDYGCADCALLQYISDAMPGVFHLTGIDISEEMLKLASENLNRDRSSEDGGHISLVTPKQYANIPGKSHEACLNCGSVIHEVYSYGTPESINGFWDFVFNSGFKYIAIRDMAVSKIDISQANLTYWDALHKIHMRNKRCPSERERFHDFIHFIGLDNSAEMGWNDIVHYFLKYRYVTNWDRELRENYLPLLIEEILLKIPNNYRVKYYDHYTLPYLKDRVLQDFRFELNTKTHYKLLLERID